jgi:hypothetical protein
MDCPVHYTQLPDGDTTPDCDAPGWPLVELVTSLHGTLGATGAGRRNAAHRQRTQEFTDEFGNVWRWANGHAEFVRTRKLTP